MRQVDGSGLLGQGDARSAEIGVLYVEAEDSRQEILTAINAQELQGRKQIAIVLPEQGKAFRQPVEFDGLKNMRRGLKAQLIFIAPAGPGPAEFARQRRFVVYSSLETFKTALLNERSLNPRAKTATSGDEKKPGLLGRRNKAQPQQVAPSTPRITPAASGQPDMPPTPPTPRMPQFSEPERQPMPLIMPISQPSIDEMDTHTLELENPAGPAGSGQGPQAVHAVEDDDEMAPPMTPRQNGGPTPNPPSGSLRTPNGQRGPTPLLLGQQTNTPRPGSGKLPAASAQGSQTRLGTGKQPTVANRANRPAPPQGSGRGSGTLPSTQGTPDAPGQPRQPNGKNDGSGKIPVVVPVPVDTPAAGPAALVSSPAFPASSGAPIPAAVALTGTPGGPGAGPRQVSGLTPLPPPVSQRRQRARRRWRFLLVLLLILLSLAVIGGIVVSALGGPKAITSLGQLTADLSITPRSQTVSNNYAISAVTGTPDAAKRQVAARVIPAQSGTQQATGHATGSIAAKKATGFLTFINNNNSAVTLSPTPIIGNDGVAVSIYQNVNVPAAPTFSITVPAYAVVAGTGGNIQAFDVSRSCCTTGITVKNTSAFTGGVDAQPNSIIQQSDIDSAANPLITQLKTSTRATLEKQMKSNEQAVTESFNCNTTTNANHKVGDVTPTVTVSVSVACSEEVFDLAAAEQMVSNLLKTEQQSGIDLTGYQLVGQVITTLEGASQVSAQEQVNVEMQAAGKWVYQFTDAKQQQIKQAIANKSEAVAKNILGQYTGILSFTLNISSGSTMPSNVNDINLTIQPVSGLQPSTPTTTPSGVGSTPTGGSSTPGATSTGTPNLGGS